MRRKLRRRRLTAKGGRWHTSGPELRPRTVRLYLALMEWSSLVSTLVGGMIATVAALLS